MDAFTGKEQNRANVVPMMCQFEDANDCCRCCQQESKLSFSFFYGKIGNKKDCVANRIDKNGNNRIEVSA